MSTTNWHFWKNTFKKTKHFRCKKLRRQTGWGTKSQSGGEALEDVGRDPWRQNCSGESWDPNTGAGVLGRLTEGGLTRLGSDVLWFGQSWCDMDTSTILNTPWRHLSRDRFSHLGSLSLFVSLTHTHKAHHMLVFTVCCLRFFLVF